MFIKRKRSNRISQPTEGPSLDTEDLSSLPNRKEMEITSYPVL
jgi:hypothetical protein